MLLLITRVSRGSTSSLRRVMIIWEKQQPKWQAFGDVYISSWWKRSETARKWWLADAPVVSCESSWAHVGDRNVFVRCKVRARPKVTAIFWILDGNGTTVTEGQVVNEQWTLVMVSIVARDRNCGSSAASPRRHSLAVNCIPLQLLFSNIAITLSRRIRACWCVGVHVSTITWHNSSPPQNVEAHWFWVPVACVFWDCATLPFESAWICFSVECAFLLVYANIALILSSSACSNMQSASYPLHCLTVRPDVTRWHM